MIDPITALAGIQSAVALIKKVSKTVDDVSSLGPVLGKYFDAKNNAVKAVTVAKGGGNKSSMAIAIEIEMALDKAIQFEKELQMLFMASGKIDVWNKVKARAAALDVEAAQQAKRIKTAAANKKKQNDEMMEIILAVIFLVFIFIFSIWGLYEIVVYCKAVGCGR
jgi:hypothetical protein